MNMTTLTADTIPTVMFPTVFAFGASTGSGSNVGGFISEMMRHDARHVHCYVNLKVCISFGLMFDIVRNRS